FHLVQVIGVHTDLQLRKLADLPIQRNRSLRRADVTLVQSNLLPLSEIVGMDYAIERYGRILPHARINGDIAVRNQILEALGPCCLSVCADISHQMSFPQRICPGHFLQQIKRHILESSLQSSPSGASQVSHCECSIQAPVQDLSMHVLHVCIAVLKLVFGAKITY